MISAVNGWKVSMVLPAIRSWIVWGVIVPVSVAPSAIASWFTKVPNCGKQGASSTCAASRLNAAASSRWSCASVPVSAARSG